MKAFKITESMIQQRIIDWGLDSDSDEDYYIARESLYCDNNASIAIDALQDGVI